MKIRGVILATCAMMVFFASYACANQPEPEPVSSAKPVMVPYLNKSINEVKNEYRIITDGNQQEADGDQLESVEDSDAYDIGAVLTNAGRMESGEEEPLPELVESEPNESAGRSEDSVLTYLGEWTCTAYCPCSECCGQWATGCTASGVLATPNHTVACGILPFGTQIVIDDVIYTVEDTGVDGAWIDIYFDSHEEALAYGMQTKSVYLLEG